MGRIVWFTNMETTKRHQELTLYKNIHPKNTQGMITTEAINVDKVSDIPMGYNKMMGVPITFLDKYNPKQFEIIGH